MHHHTSHSPAERWRVALFTNVPFGFDLFRPCIESLGHRVVAVVTTPGPRRRRNADYLDVVASVPPSVDVLVTNHPRRFATLLAPYQPDLIVSAGFPWRIPADAIALPRLGAVSVHPSLLPRHRGPHPIEWAFRSGDRQTGFTLHELQAEFDTGAILSQQAVPIEDDDDGHSLLDRITGQATTLFAEGLSRVAKGLPGISQDEALATYAGPLEEDFRQIDWSRSAREIHNQVRSWTGLRGVAAGAIGTINGLQHTILKTRLPQATPPGNPLPGTLLNSEHGELLVQCGDGPLTIVNWTTQSDREDPAEVEQSPARR